MSEVDRHYGGEAPPRARANIEGGARSHATSGERGGVRERAADAVDDVRERVSQTAGRLREEVSDRYDRAQDWASRNADTLSRNAVYARRRSVAELNRGRRSVESFVEENPIMVGVAGLAAGLLIGALLPATRQENELVGRYADDVRREGLRYAKDVAQQGRETLSETLRAAARTREDDHPQPGNRPETGRG